MKYLSLLAFAMILFACGGTTENTTEMPEMETPTVETPTAPAMAPSEDVTATISAVQSAGGDITALEPGTAVSNIDMWIGKLSSMDGTDGIVSDLESLKTELTSGNIDGGRVSGLLSNLANGTRSVAGGNSGLTTLASALDAGAAKLGGK